MHMDMDVEVLTLVIIVPFIDVVTAASTAPNHSATRGAMTSQAHSKSNSV